MRLGRCPYAAANAPVRTMCQPQAEGQGWRCGREEHQGGPCHQGPGADGHCAHPLPPCQPSRSSRWRKSLMWRTTLAVTVACLVLMLGGGDDLAMLQPGPVQAHHANIEDCQSCHHEPEQYSWHAIDVWRGAGHNDFSGCLACHDLGPNAGNAHDQSYEWMHAVADEYGVGHLPVSQSADGCGVCHKEHGDVTVISADREGCVSCHRMDVVGFDDSHPAVDEPTPRRLIFSHDSHLQQHFRKPRLQAVAPDCTGCHLPSTAGTMRLAGFDEACSVCHLDDDILDQGGDKPGPQTVLALPRIDAENADLTWWPNCKTSGLNQTTDLPPITRYLLQLDPAAAEAMALLDADGTRLDRLDGATDEQRAAANVIGSTLKARLEKWPAVDEAGWLASVPPDLIRLLNKEWFADNGDGCADSEQWRWLRDEQGKGRSELASLRGWYVQAGTRTVELGYRAQAHSDDWMQQLADYAVAHGGQLSPLTDPDDGLSCFSCHLEDETGLQWSSASGVAAVDFDHRPHATGQQCIDCHVPVDIEERSDPPAALFDYQQVTVDQCTDCHQPSKVPAECHDCHDYHRGHLARHDVRP